MHGERELRVIDTRMRPAHTPFPWVTLTHSEGRGRGLVRALTSCFVRTLPDSAPVVLAKPMPQLDLGSATTITLILRSKRPVANGLQRIYGKEATSRMSPPCLVELSLCNTRASEGPQGNSRIDELSDRGLRRSPLQGFSAETARSRWPDPNQPRNQSAAGEETGSSAGGDGEGDSD